jgi:acyl-coenzyme A synthetase/AMP-(fatty) acid ligase/aryl carrier-like protein
MEKTVENYLYIVDAWKEYLQNDPRAVVLSDSLGHDCRRSEVDDLSDRVHTYLKRNNIGKNDAVLIHLERGVKPVIAIMGVIKAGAAFTIVEAGYAKERVDFIRTDCNTKFELNEDNWGEAIACDPTREYVRPDDHDLALCVYTSGTSGNPKGVMHEYGQYKLEMISEMQEDGTWRENTGTRWGLVAPLNFVASLKIIVHFMYCGGHLYVMDYNTVKNPVKLTAYLLRNRINETFLSPSLLRLKGKEMGPFMKYVYTGAEPANNVAVKNVLLVNTYTMSESFFTVTEFGITKPYSIAPIGKPLFDLDIRLIDEDGNIVVEGETGEMCFYNPYCRGYINLPQENEKHFIDGYFHTGDLAAFTDGEYVLKGRNDDMIKIDGNRIEPSEIETACRKALGLSWCAAKGFEKEAVVALYYTDKVEINEDEARQKLESKLPYYMIPSYFIHIDKVPLTASGKLNRKDFTLPAAAMLAEYIAPRNEIEKKLVEVMAEVLGLDRIGIKDDFFKLGGNSIRAMEVLEKLRMDGLNINLFYRGRTVEKISDLYKSEASNYMSDEEKEMVGKTSRIPLSPFDSYIWNFLNNGSEDFIAAYQLSPLISLKKLRDAFNAYMEINSSFHVVIENDGDKPVNVYNPEPQQIEIETMSEKEVEELQKNFIQPFETGKPLYRIRLIKTRLHKYLFFQMSHILTDGAGMYLITKDIETLYKGGYVQPAYYFANVYNTTIPLSEEFMKNAADYYGRKLDYKHKMRRLIEDHTDLKGQKIARIISFPLNKIENLVSRYNSTYAGFIHLAVLLATDQYNGKPSLLRVSLENRSPNENIAGTHLRTGAVTITTESKSLLDLFEDMNVQQYNNIKYADYDYGMQVLAEDEFACFNISYVGDWFDPDKQTMYFGKEIALENQYKTVTDTCILNFNVRQERGKMVFRFDYDTSSLTEEHAEKYMSLLEFAGNELLEGRYPQFSKEDED